MNGLFRLNTAEGLTLYSMVYTGCLLVLPDKGLHNMYKGWRKVPVYLIPPPVYKGPVT